MVEAVQTTSQRRFPRNSDLDSQAFLKRLMNTKSCELVCLKLENRSEGRNRFPHSIIVKQLKT